MLTCVQTIIMMSHNDEREDTLMTNVRPNIRSFRRTRAQPQVMHEFSETEAMIALCNLQGSRFGYALNNGAIGTYDVQKGRGVRK